MTAGESEPQNGADSRDEQLESAVDETRRQRLRRAAIGIDTQPALLSAATRLRRRLPGDERFGDVLSTAGTQPVEVMARGVSALRPDRRSLVQELGLAGLQVWQSLSEATGRGRGDHELAILFTDLVGFSSWALRAGDAATLELLRAVGTALEAAVTEHRGRIVKRLGDGIMATFLTARPAVEAALEAQAAVAEVNLDGHTPQMRAGLHWGYPRKLGGDYLGVDVNVAARVSDAAKAGEVLVSDALLTRLESGELRVGKAKRLRADGAPRNLEVAPITRA
ncbi:MAG: adenylate/guanylate cyclase domain-containing protein [Actinomycetota bacterium]|nr:adenylate/guanylate cyclase domain-containing protein [Actinomycetota bacterium]